MRKHLAPQFSILASQEMGRKKHQLVLVANPQVLGALPEVWLSPLCPFRRPEPYLYLGQKQVEKKTDPRHSWCPQIIAASVIYLFLPLSTLWAEGEPHVSTEPSSSPALGPKGHWKCPNLPQIGPGLSGTKPGPFPG